MCIVILTHERKCYKDGVAQWVAHLTCDRSIPVSREFEPYQSPRCFLEQETLLSLLSTGWFQERI